MRTKAQHRLEEAVKLIVTRGAAVEESRMMPKIVFRSEGIGADKWIVPCEYMYHVSPCKFSNGDFAYEL
jgi:hypothetical protein